MSHIEMIAEIKDAALHPDDTVRKSIEKNDKKAFGCFPIYTPEEIIYAAGLLPIGMWGGKVTPKMADKYLQSFCCTIMRINLELGIRGTYDLLQGVILPTFCDTLKCICENWKVAVPKVPIIAMTYPQNKNTEAGKKYMLEELSRIKKELEDLIGVSITEKSLEEAWDVYEEYRATMREFSVLSVKYPKTIDPLTRHLIIKASYFMDKKEYTEKLKAIMESLMKEPDEKSWGPKVIAVGLISEPNEILGIMAENEMTIVGDDLAHESRQYRTIGRKTGSVIEKIAGRVEDQFGDTFFYDENKRRGGFIIDLVKKQNADAVIVFMMKFCDPEEFDYPIYKEEIEAAGIPLLYIEVDQLIDSYAQIQTRIQSFSEMLV